MAPTLAFFSSPSPVLHHLVPPPSQEFGKMQQMPDVFVTPPEEEHAYNPPFCYFDATQAATNGFSTGPDLDVLDVALDLCQQRDNRAPVFRRTFTNESQETIVMPRRRSFMKLTGVGDADLEDGQTDIRSRSVRKFDDSEIVEVVKVRRNEGMADIGIGRPEKLKKSNTFRARASQALRSIKLNVGKGQRRATVSEPQSQDEQQGSSHLPPQTCTQDELPSVRSASPSPSISRRRSLTLSHFFTFKDKENQSSSRPATPSEEPMSPTSPPLAASESAPSLRPMSPTESIASFTQHLRTSSSLEDCATSPTLVAEPLGPEDPSKPTLSKRKSFRRRLSVLELQKIFTLGGSSTSPTDTASPDEHVDTPVSPTRSRPKSIDFASILSPSSSRTSNASAASDWTTRLSSSSQLSNGGVIDEDDELEMRLDSLHFDSLHFDPDEIMSSL